MCSFRELLLSSEFGSIHSIPQSSYAYSTPADRKTQLRSHWKYFRRSDSYPIVHNKIAVDLSLHCPRHDIVGVIFMQRRIEHVTFIDICDYETCIALPTEHNFGWYMLESDCDLERFNKKAVCLFRQTASSLRAGVGFYFKEGNVPARRGQAL
jgi:hypothetical protein